MGNENKGAAGGAIRKTEEGAFAPDSPADDVPGGAAVADKAPAVGTKADKKAKKAINDKASKIKREKIADAEKIAETEAAAKRGFFIAEGKAITSGKGILGPGDRVKPEYFGKDGEEVFKRLVKSDAIKEVK